MRPALDFGTTDDLLTLGTAVTVIWLVRKLLERVVVEPLMPLVLVQNTRRYRTKLLEDTWYLVYYIVSFSAGIYVARPEKFFTDFEWFWIQYPENANPTLRLYYLWELGFYIQGFVSLVFIELRKKDFLEMALHHVVTILLVGISYLTRNHRIGVMVLLVHDFSDIGLYLARWFHDCSMMKTRDAVFAIFACSFFSSRLVVYPFWVIAACWNVSAQTWVTKYNVVLYHDTAAAWPFEISQHGVCVLQNCMSPHWFLTGLLCVLVGLHTFWFYLIARMVARALRTSSVGNDIREESDEENAEPAPATKDTKKQS